MTQMELIVELFYANLTYSLGRGQADAVEFIFFIALDSYSFFPIFTHYILCMVGPVVFLCFKKTFLKHLLFCL